MAHFAKINSDNIVEKVIKVSNDILLENGVESEQKGVDFCKSIFGQDTNWKQTSYNTYKGKYYNNYDYTLGDQSKAFRKNFAGNGYSYDQQRDAFISPKPSDAHIFNEETCSWDEPSI